MTLSKEELETFVDLHFNEIECDDGDEVWNEFSGKIENFRKFADCIYRIGYTHEH